MDMRLKKCGIGALGLLVDKIKIPQGSFSLPIFKISRGIRREIYNSTNPSLTGRTRVAVQHLAELSTNFELDPL
jgi:hypothetical protein